MIKKTILLMICLFPMILNRGQDPDDYLGKVTLYNPEINAWRKLLEAKALEARTGVAPADPLLTAGYMPGNPESGGTKKTWTAIMDFDFPSRYLLQKKLNSNTLLLAEQEFRLGALRIISDARQTIMDQIYNAKRLNLLYTRKEGFVKMQSAWKKMLDEGEATILDYNRIMLEISSVNLDITRRETETAILKDKLSYMSGGNAAEFFEYPLIEDPGPDSILAEKRLVHPSFIIPEIETKIRAGELKVSKTGSLPGFQIGYTSEILPGQSYTGPVAGISVPLWSNSFRVRTASAFSEYSKAALDAEVMRLTSEIRRDYATMKALKAALLTAKELLEQSGDPSIAGTALQNGEISITTYFDYLETGYSTEERVLELEHEYNRSLASLLDYKLIGRFLR